MIVYADELDELFPEETDKPISTEETSKDTLMKSEYVRITVNGTDVPKISDVFDSFFLGVKFGETEDNITEVMIPKNMELSDMLWDMGDFEGPDYILADIDSRTYRIDGIEKSGYITDIIDDKEYTYDFSSENSSSAEFIIPFESEKRSSFTGNPFITVTDNVGNQSVIKFLKSD